MKICLLGFNDFQGLELKTKIEKILTEEKHEIVETQEEADLLLVPHHLSKLFPVEKPWIAIWAVHSWEAQLPDKFKQEHNPAKALVYGLSTIKNGLKDDLIEALEKL